MRDRITPPDVVSRTAAAKRPGETGATCREARLCRNHASRLVFSGVIAVLACSTQEVPGPVLDASSEPPPIVDAGAEPAGCGEFSGDSVYTCSRDGNSRGKCVA